MKENLFKYRSHIILMGLFVFLIHCAKVNSNIIGIDTEDLINMQEGFYGGWLQSGRYGLVGLKYLLGNVQFNPYFSGIMTLLLLTAAVVAFLMLWDAVGGKESNSGSKVLPWALGGLLWISHPVLTEQFYFSLQSMEICVGLLGIACAMHLAYHLTSKWNWIWCAVCVGVLVWVFAIYQIFVVLFIFGVVTMLLVEALQECEKVDSSKLLLKKMLRYCGIFLAAFLLNSLITKLFFSSSDYIQNQVVWGQASLKDCILAIGIHVGKVFLGYQSPFYSIGFGALALINLLLLFRYLKVKKTGKGTGAVILFFYMALLVTPFLMTFVVGTAPAIRSQLVLPLVTGFQGYFGAKLLEWQLDSIAKEISRKLILGCVVAIALVGGIHQTKVTYALYYTDSCRYEHDVALARELIQLIGRINYDGTELPVVVIGAKEFKGNSACVMGETIGKSFFDYDMDVEPVCYWSSRRALGFMNSLGLNSNLVTVDRIEEAKEYSLYMPAWPYEGCVQEYNGMIVVKLSNWE